MFGTRRPGFPVTSFLLIAVGFALASVVGTAGSVLGAVFFLPLLALKFMFFFFMFGMVMRAFGGRFGGPSHYDRRSSWSRRDPRGRPHDAPPVEPTQAEKDWAQAQEAARQEIEDLFPDSDKLPDSATMDE